MYFGNVYVYTNEPLQQFDVFGHGKTCIWAWSSRRLFPMYIFGWLELVMF